MLISLFIFVHYFSPLELPGRYVDLLSSLGFKRLLHLADISDDENVFLVYSAPEDYIGHDLKEVEACYEAILNSGALKDSVQPVHLWRLCQLSFSSRIHRDPVCVSLVHLILSGQGGKILSLYHDLELNYCKEVRERDLNYFDNLISVFSPDELSGTRFSELARSQDFVLNLLDHRDQLSDRVQEVSEKLDVSLELLREYEAVIGSLSLSLVTCPN